MAQTKTGFITLTDLVDGQPGTQGASVLVIYAEDAAGTNQSTDIGSREFVNYHEYTGTTPSVPVSGLTFVQFVGTGSDGASIFPIYADDAAGAGQSFSPTGKKFVTFFEASTIPTLDVTGQTFVRYVGEDGIAGSFVITAYRNNNDEPGTPVGGTETVAPVLPEEWSYTATDETDLQRWKSNARFGDGAVASFEVSEIEFFGSTGGVTSDPGTAEVTTLGITGGSGTGKSSTAPAAPSAEQTTITFTGTSGSTLAGGFKRKTSGGTSGLRDAAFGAFINSEGALEDVYVVVGDAYTVPFSDPAVVKGTITINSDPTTDLWNLNLTPGMDRSSRGVAYGLVGGTTPTWVSAGTGSGNIYRATDPSGTWSQQASTLTTSRLDITYGNGIFVVVGSSGEIRSSIDGITWVEETTKFEGDTTTTVSFGTIFGIEHRDPDPSIMGDTGLFVVVGDSGLIATSPGLASGESPGDMIWRRRNSSGSTLFGVGFGLDDAGNDLWVTAGGSSIRTSVDGISNWTSRSSAGSSIKDATHIGGGAWIAPGITGNYLLSTDGTTWNNAAKQWRDSSNVQIFNNDIESSQFLNNTFIAVGAPPTGANQEGTIITIDSGELTTLIIDGDDRQFPNGPIEVPLNSASSGTSMASQALALIEGTTDGVANTNTAGFTRTTSTNVLQLNSTINSTPDTAGPFGNIIVGLFGGTLTSAAAAVAITDGEAEGGSKNEQTQLTFSGTSGDPFSSLGERAPISLTRGLQDSAFGQDNSTPRNDIYVAVGQSESGGAGIIYTATDPTSQASWTRNGTSRTSVDGKTLEDVAYDGNGRWIAVANGGAIITTTEGPAGSWSELLGHGITSNLLSVRFARGVWLVTGQGVWTATPATVTSGSAWELEDDTSSGFFNFGLELDDANGVFVVVGNSGKILRSAVPAGDITPGSMSWTAPSSPFSSRLRAVTYGDNLWVVVGNSGQLAISSDGGLSWQTRDPGATITLDGVTYANGTFIVVGASGVIRTSTNGTDWVAGPSSGTNLPLNGISFENNQIIIVGGASANNDGLIFIPTGTPSTLTITGDTSEFGITGSISRDFTGLSDSVSMASQAADLLADKTTGLTIAVVGNIVGVDSLTGGTRTVIASAPSIPGGGTVGVTIRSGTAPSTTTASTFTITATGGTHNPSSFTGTFGSEVLPAVALATVRDAFLGATPDIGGYTAVITGTSLTLTSTVNGNEDPNLTFELTQGTNGDLSRSISVANGEDPEAVTVDTWEVIIDGTSHTGNFVAGSNPETQANRVKDNISGAFGTSINAEKHLVITATVTGNQPNTTAIITEGSDSSARGTDPADPFPRTESTDGLAVPNWSSPVQDGFDGIIGLDGPPGSRGAGRFDRNFTKLSAGVLDEDTTKFNEAARCAVAGGYPFNTTGTAVTCKEKADGSGATVAFIPPVKGDTVVLTVTDSGGGTGSAVSTSAAIHDGTGVLNEDWIAFAVQIDGNLLVNGTVVTDKLAAEAVDATKIAAGAITIGAVTTSGVPNLKPENVGAGVINFEVNANGEVVNSADQTLAEWITAGNTAATFVPDPRTASRMVITGSKIEIYEGTTLRVVLGDLD